MKQRANAVVGLSGVIGAAREERKAKEPGRPAVKPTRESDSP